MVPVAAGEPVALGVNVQGVERLTAKPDGTGLLISGGGATFEVSAWAGIK